MSYDMELNDDVEFEEMRSTNNNMSNKLEEQSKVEYNRVLVMV